MEDTFGRWVLTKRKKIPRKRSVGRHCVLGKSTPERMKLRMKGESRQRLQAQPRVNRMRSKIVTTVLLLKRGKQHCVDKENSKAFHSILQYFGEMDSRFWNGLSADFRRFWKQRLPIEIFRIEAYMTVVGLPSALKKYILKLCTSLSRNDGIQPNLGGYSRILKYLKPFTSSITMEIHAYTISTYIPSN